MRWAESISNVCALSMNVPALLVSFPPMRRLGSCAEKNDLANGTNARCRPFFLTA